MDMGPTELIIILVIVLVLFGASRVAHIGRDLGAAIREFRKGMTSEVSEKSADESSDR